jgi:hypothetical protein
MGKLCYKRVSRPSCVTKGLRGTSRHRTRRREKSSPNLSPGKVVTERVAVDISSPVVGLIVRLLGVVGCLRGRKRFKMDTWSGLPMTPQAFQTLGVVRVNCVTNKLHAQSRHRTRRRAESRPRTCRRRHLAARSGPNLTSSSRVEVFVPPERAQNGDLVWPACVPSGIFAWRPKGRVGNTELQ